MKTLIELAREAVGSSTEWSDEVALTTVYEVDRFAALVRQQVIEELAGVEVEPVMSLDWDGASLVYAPFSTAMKLPKGAYKLVPIEAIAAARVQRENSAYLAGFNASGEGYNGEYPFSDHNVNPESDKDWVKTRDESLEEIRNQEISE